MSLVDDLHQLHVKLLELAKQMIKSLPSMSDEEVVETLELWQRVTREMEKALEVVVRELQSRGLVVNLPSMDQAIADLGLDTDQKWVAELRESRRVALGQ